MCEQSVSFSFYKPEVCTLVFRIVIFLTDSLEVSVNVCSKMYDARWGIVSTVFIVIFEMEL